MMHGLRTQHPQAWAPSSAVGGASTAQGGGWWALPKPWKIGTLEHPPFMHMGSTARTLKQLATRACQPPGPAPPDNTYSYQKKCKIGSAPGMQACALLDWHTAACTVLKSCLNEM